jgi:hypothetical protein
MENGQPMNLLGGVICIKMCLYLRCSRACDIACPLSEIHGHGRPNALTAIRSPPQSTVRETGGDRTGLEVQGHLVDNFGMLHILKCKSRFAERSEVMKRPEP